MGKDTSGLSTGANVRGFFGDGLKEGVLGLRRGGVLKTIQKGEYAHAELSWEDEKPVFRLRQSGTPATAALRKEIGLRDDGTNLSISVDPEIRIPRQDSLVEQLSRHYALRDILQNPARSITVRRLNAKERVISQDEASYTEPLADESFATVTLQGTVPTFGDPFSIEIMRAVEALSGAEAGPLREGGLLVRARRAIVDMGFFGHENRPGTEYLFGHLQCDALYERLRTGDVVVTKNRSGLNRQNEFVKALLSEVARLLEPLVVREAERLRTDTSEPVDAKSKRRLDELKNELNRIARLELEEEGDEPGDAEGSAALRFARKGYHLNINEPRTVRVFAKAELVKEHTRLELSAFGAGLQLVPTDVDLTADDAVDGFVAFDSQLLGIAELAEGLIEAKLGPNKATAPVSVRQRVDAVPATFAFERDSFRLPVSKWKELTLRIHVPGVVLPAEVAFSVDSNNVQIRSGMDAQVADPSKAKGEWLTIQVAVRGEQIGAEDTLEARMGNWVATAKLRVVSASDENDKNKRGGPIRDIRFDARPDPVQRTLFQSGEITVFVEHPSVQRYLSRQDEREKPAGRALIADLVMQAFSRYVAEESYRDDPFVNDADSAIHTVFNTYEKMMKKYGERIHGIMNPK